MYTVNVNGETWTIEFVPSFDYNLMRSDGTYTIGVCNDETKTIYIDKNLRNRFEKNVLKKTDDYLLDNVLNQLTSRYELLNKEEIKLVGV